MSELQNEFEIRCDKCGAEIEIAKITGTRIIARDRHGKTINYKEQSDEIKSQLDKRINIFKEGYNTLAEMNGTLYEEKQDESYTLRRRAYLIK